jgi:hypothetical protein
MVYRKVGDFSFPFARGDFYTACGMVFSARLASLRAKRIHVANRSEAEFNEVNPTGDGMKRVRWIASLRSQ